MRRRAFLVLSGSGALAACTPSVVYQPPPYIVPASRMPGVPPPPGSTVGLLLPLSGRLADIAQAMRQAAQLALSGPSMPTLLAEDTNGSGSGAQAGLHRALAGGAGLILGPLTAAETDVVATAAVAAGVPVLAFTNTVTAARPGVWTLGITPTQQVDRLVRYARAQGRARFAALLPDSDFGHALATALTAAVAEQGLAPAAIAPHGPGPDATDAALRGLIGPASPPPFDVLLLGDTGSALGSVAAALQATSVGAPGVQIIGPALWGAPASQSAQLPGAWYAAPDPAARAAFARAFIGRFNASPPGPADLAYDAASIARVLAPRGYSVAALTSPAGFSGADGWLRLLPDGRVQRGLAVFQVAPGGGRPISAAPASASAFAA